MPHTFFLPTKILSGQGSIAELAREAAQWPAPVLLVTDPGIIAAGLAKQVANVLESGGIAYEIYSDVKPNPTVENAESAAKTARSANAGVLVAVGGGSAIDTAKAASLLMTNGGSLTDYEGFDRFENPPVPVIAIPTTAGTGSEVTIVAVMHDEASNRKFTVGGARMAPKVALLDAALTMKLPPKITAYTGMDALTHALESYTSVRAQPVTDAINLNTISTILQCLPKAALRGDDAGAREGMLYAACMAGITCNATFLGLVHAIASPLCARYDAPHGLVCAVLLPAVMRYNLPAAVERYAAVAHATGAATRGQSAYQSALAAVEAVVRLGIDTGIPASLLDIGIDDAHIEEIAEAASIYPQAMTNCRRASAGDIAAILRGLL